MRKVLLIALRDYTAAVRTKSFLIGLLVLPLLMGGGLVVFKLTEGRVDIVERRIAILDHTGVVAAGLVEAAQRRNETEIFDKQTGQQIAPAYVLFIVEPQTSNLSAQRLELSNKVRSGELSAFLEIEKGVLALGKEAFTTHLAYYSENPLFDSARQWMQGPLNELLQRQRIKASKLDMELIQRVTVWLPIESFGLVTVDAATGHTQAAKPTNKLQVIGIPYAMMLLMFVLIMVTVNPILHSTLEEKMNRIAEVLLGSVTPSQFMYGKLLGAISVSITMIFIYITAGLLTVYYLDMNEIIPYRVLPWFALYGVAALFMFGACFLAVGSACTDLKESQSVMLPVWAFVFLPMFFWFPVMKEPTGALATYLSLFPTCTPMLMIVRLSSSVTIPVWQPWIGLIGVLLFTIGSVWAAGRIFRVGILSQGKTPRLGEIFRWALRG